MKSMKAIGTAAAFTTLIVTGLVVGSQRARAESESGPVSVSGQIAVKDKTTGKLRAPTAEEAAELSKASAQRPARRAAAPAVRVDASGVMSATLGEEYENYEVAGIGADGKLVRDCVDGSQNAQDRLKTPPATLEKE